VLNAGGGYYGLAEYIEEAKRKEIKVLGPDVNRSYSILFGGLPNWKIVPIFKSFFSFFFQVIISKGMCCLPPHSRYMLFEAAYWEMSFR